MKTAAKNETNAAVAPLNLVVWLQNVQGTGMWPMIDLPKLQRLLAIRRAMRVEDRPVLLKVIQALKTPDAEALMAALAMLLPVQVKCLRVPFQGKALSALRNEVRMLGGPVIIGPRGTATPSWAAAMQETVLRRNLRKAMERRVIGRDKRSLPVEVALKEIAEVFGKTCTFSVPYKHQGQAASYLLWVKTQMECTVAFRFEESEDAMVDEYAFLLRTRAVGVPMAQKLPDDAKKKAAARSDRDRKAAFDKRFPPVVLESAETQEG